jgi:hypothetical protein
MTEARVRTIFSNVRREAYRYSAYFDEKSLSLEYHNTMVQALTDSMNDRSAPFDGAKVLNKVNTDFQEKLYSRCFLKSGEKNWDYIHFLQHVSSVAHRGGTPVMSAEWEGITNAQQLALYELVLEMDYPEIVIFLNGGYQAHMLVRVDTGFLRRDEYTATTTYTLSPMTESVLKMYQGNMAALIEAYNTLLFHGAAGGSFQKEEKIFKAYLDAESMKIEAFRQILENCTATAYEKGKGAAFDGERVGSPPIIELRQNDDGTLYLHIDKSLDNKHGSLKFYPDRAIYESTIHPFNARLRHDVVHYSLDEIKRFAETKIVAAEQALAEVKSNAVNSTMEDAGLELLFASIDKMLPPTPQAAVFLVSVEILVGAARQAEETETRIKEYETLIGDYKKIIMGLENAKAADSYYDAYAIGGHVIDFPDGRKEFAIYFNNTELEIRARAFGEYINQGKKEDDPEYQMITGERLKGDATLMEGYYDWYFNKQSKLDDYINDLTPIFLEFEKTDSEYTGKRLENLTPSQIARLDDELKARGR